MEGVQLTGHEIIIMQKSLIDLPESAVSRQDRIPCLVLFLISQHTDLHENISETHGSWNPNMVISFE